MYTTYSLSGSINVRDVPEVHAIIEAFRLNAGELTVTVHTNEDDSLSLEFGGSQRLDFLAIEEIDSSILELAPYVLDRDNAYVLYRFDDQLGELTFGE